MEASAVHSGEDGASAAPLSRCPALNLAPENVTDAPPAPTAPEIPVLDHERLDCQQVALEFAAMVGRAAFVRAEVAITADNSRREFRQMAYGAPKCTPTTVNLVAVYRRRATDGLGTVEKGSSTFLRGGLSTRYSR